MLAMTLALATAAPTVIDAERAFAQMAQDKGQWTAFRATADPQAVMFTPQPVNAHEFLKPLKDPAKALRWWPVEAWVSCDGTLAVDTGAAVWPDGHFSRYVTVWRRQPDGGLKWVYDNGEDVTVRPAQPKTVVPARAACTGEIPITFKSIDPLVRTGHISSSDGTLTWDWSVERSGAHGGYALRWDGTAYQPGTTLRVPPRK